MDTLLKEAPHGGVYAPESGLAAWLFGWLRTSLRVKITGIGKARAKPHLELVEMLQLGGKRQLMLVRCDGERYLLGAGEGGIHSIVCLQVDAPMGTSCDAMNAAYARDLSGTPQTRAMEMRCNS